MTEKLRSHLKSEKGLARREAGFTLIELLVVIAIIAILVVIVIVAINPIERLNEANDRKAASNVHSAGTLIATCVTHELSLTPAGDPATTCETNVHVAANGSGTVPADVTVEAGAAAGEFCASEVGRTGTTWVYRQLTGQVTSQTTAFTC